jgi:hypothetical protein
MAENVRRQNMYPTLFHLILFAISIAIAVWAIRQLYRCGLNFLEEVFPSRLDLARKIAQTMTAGCAFGIFGDIAEDCWSMLVYTNDPRSFFEQGLSKIGALSIATAVVYFLYMLILTRFGNRSTRKPAEAQSASS